METSIKFQQRTSQHQKQTMTQKLSQKQIMSVNLLNMSALDLRENIYEFAEKNPALEIVNDHLEEGAGSVKVHNVPSDNLHMASATDRGKQESDRFQAALESNEDKSESLKDHLEHQFLSMKHDPYEEELGLKLIHNLDENGFHILSPQSFIKTDLAGDHFDQLEAVMDQIQRLDPVGCCVKDFKESLFVQARLEKDCPPCAMFLLNGHFDFLNPPQTSKIQKKITEHIKTAKALSFMTDSESNELKELMKNPFGEKEILQALEFIRKLDPFPARDFSNQKTVFISPDVYVEKIPADEDDVENGIVSNSNECAFRITVARDSLPVLGLNPQFEKLAAQVEKDSSGKEKSEQKKAEIKFAKECIAEAKIYIDSINYRQSTIAKAAAEILRCQSVFFEKGPRYLAPLRQKDVAAAIGVHEATISRMANDKYLQCEWGLFAFSYFFTNAVGTDNTSSVMAQLNDSPAASKQAVKYEIQQILKEHQQDEKALSDQKVADLLAKKGIKIARRTVAKYRGELKLASSYDR